MDRMEGELKAKDQQIQEYKNQLEKVGKSGTEQYQAFSKTLNQLKCKVKHDTTIA